MTTKLKQLREDRQWSQSELARRAHVHCHQVSMLERGRFLPPRGSITMRKLAVALGLDASEGDALIAPEVPR